LREPDDNPDNSVIFFRGCPIPFHPEDHAREKIDALLASAGWVVQSRPEMNLGAGPGAAVREFAMDSGPVDYALFVNRTLCGVIEAKADGTTLSGFSEQAARYIAEAPAHLVRHEGQVRFEYVASGTEILFRDHADPAPRSRRVFTFHRPETLQRWLTGDATIRRRLQAMPPLITEGLRDCQTDAVRALEASLAADRPRALIQMATGAGKTFTACTFSYRLLAHAGFRRILFLADRANLVRQARDEFLAYRPAGTGHSFTELFNVQKLGPAGLDASASVVISTIQRVYSVLTGHALSEEDEEHSGFEGGDGDAERAVRYNPALPIETFDLVITDECHRSIYGTWRQVLDYFDAFIVGLTATPSLHTMGFFNRNLVAQYPYERSVADGVNVGYEIYRIRTEIGEHGGRVPAQYEVPVRDRRTRAQRYEQLTEDLVYTARDLDRSVTAPNQIRTVIEAYRDSLFTDLFPGRTEVPKTLVFAKDDHHAEEIVGIVREVFGRGNDFAQKITYKVDQGDPENLIRRFRNDYNPRIAVTVDMIATGTDVKPLEVLIFMRDVRSELYFEQMKGRGARTINPTALRQVTPDAAEKTRFVLIDAVGVTESLKQVSQPLERKRAIGFDKLIDGVAAGRRDDDAISTLAGRLAALDRKIDPADRARIAAKTGGLDPRAIANRLLDTVDPDAIERQVVAQHGPDATGRQREAVRKALKDAACEIFDDPALRQLLKDVKRITEIRIDTVSTDAVISSGYDERKAQDAVDRFEAFLTANRDELVALQILYGRPRTARTLDRAIIEELRDALRRPPWLLEPVDIWRAYARLDDTRVRGNPARALSDIVMLVRYAIGAATTLEPLSSSAAGRFNLWLGREEKAGRVYTDAQKAWLTAIRDYIAVNVAIAPQDLNEAPDFAAQGGVARAYALFGARLKPLLEELPEVLVA
jgi:type I restriction enzyme, R subunit